MGAAGVDGYVHVSIQLNDFFSVLDTQEYIWHFSTTIQSLITIDIFRVHIAGVGSVHNELTSQHWHSCCWGSHDARCPATIAGATFLAISLQNFFIWSIMRQLKYGHFNWSLRRVTWEHTFQIHCMIRYFHGKHNEISSLCKYEFPWEFDLVRLVTRMA